MGTSLPTGSFSLSSKINFIPQNKKPSNYSFSHLADKQISTHFLIFLSCCEKSGELTTACAGCAGRSGFARWMLCLVAGLGWAALGCDAWAGWAGWAALEGCWARLAGLGCQGCFGCQAAQPSQAKQQRRHSPVSQPTKPHCPIQPAHAVRSFPRLHRKIRNESSFLHLPNKRRNQFSKFVVSEYELETANQGQGPKKPKIR